MGRREGASLHISWIKALRLTRRRDVEMIKDIEELAFKKVSDADVAKVLPKILSKVIEGEARQHRVARQLLRMNTQILNKPGRSVHLRKRGDIVAADVEEAATPAEQDADYDTIISTPTKGGVTLKITQECIDDNEFDVIKDQMVEVGEAMALWEDHKCWREIISGTTEQTYTGSGSGGVGTHTLGKTNVTSIRSIKVDGTETAPSVVDYDSGKVQVSAGTGTNNVVIIFWYYDVSGDRTTDEINKADTAADWDLDDIREVRMSIKRGSLQQNRKGWMPNVMVVSPWIESKLLKLENFIDASRYGDREPILNGEIGKIMGLKVIVTTALDLYGATVCVIDTRHAGWFVNKRNMYIKKKELQENDAWAFYVYQRFSAAITNYDAVMIGIHAGQYSGDI